LPGDLEIRIPEKNTGLLFGPVNAQFSWSEFLVHDGDENAGRTQRSVRAGELVFFGNSFK
jgi:hypothetical protein